MNKYHVDVVCSIVITFEQLQTFYIAFFCFYWITYWWFQHNIYQPSTICYLNVNQFNFMLAHTLCYFFFYCHSFIIIGTIKTGKNFFQIPLTIGHEPIWFACILRFGFFFKWFTKPKSLFSMFESAHICLNRSPATCFWQYGLQTLT